MEALYKWVSQKRIDPPYGGPIFADGRCLTEAKGLHNLFRLL
jgi:hypothetical protein